MDLMLFRAIGSQLCFIAVHFDGKLIVCLQGTDYRAHPVFNFHFSGMGKRRNEELRCWQFVSRSKRGLI
eukprot:4071626-Amphidinium_carterae.1